MHFPKRQAALFSVKASNTLESWRLSLPLPSTIYSKAVNSRVNEEDL